MSSCDGGANEAAAKEIIDSCGISQISAVNEAGVGEINEPKGLPLATMEPLGDTSPNVDEGTADGSTKEDSLPMVNVPEVDTEQVATEKAEEISAEVSGPVRMASSEVAASVQQGQGEQCHGVSGGEAATVASEVLATEGMVEDSSTGKKGAVDTPEPGAEVVSSQQVSANDKQKGSVADGDGGAIDASDIQEKHGGVKFKAAEEKEVPAVDAPRESQPKANGLTSQYQVGDFIGGEVVSIDSRGVWIDVNGDKTCWPATAEQQQEIFYGDYIVDARVTYVGESRLLADLDRPELFVDSDDEDQDETHWSSSQLMSQKGWHVEQWNQNAWQDSHSGTGWWQNTQWSQKGWRCGGDQDIVGS